MNFFYEYKNGNSVTEFYSVYICTQHTVHTHLVRPRSIHWPGGKRRFWDALTHAPSAGSTSHSPSPIPRLVSCSFVNVIDFMPELLTKVVVPLSLPVWGLSEGDSLA